MFPEIFTSRKVKSKFNVDKLSDPDKAPYDMIIRTNLLVKLAMDLRFSNLAILVWNNLTAPMHTGKEIKMIWCMSWQLKHQS